MIKMIAAARRRPGMTHGEYIAYIQHVHAVLARSNPVSLQRYVQNHVFDSAYGTTAESTHRVAVHRDSVTELYWPTMQAMQETFAHPYTQKTIGPDGRNFADTGVTTMLIAHDLTLPVPKPGTGGAKVMQFLRMKDGLALPEFFERWRAAHEVVMKESMIAATTIRACVQSHQLQEANHLLAYFGSEDRRYYEGVASFWYEDDAAIGAFRQYEAALLKVNAEPSQSFYSADDSFFLYVRESHVL
jgi:hypothetical protein